MKKQKQVTIMPKDMTEMVRSHKAKQVSPPQEANRNTEGNYSVSRAEAARFWFEAAKEQNPSSGFLDVPSEKLNPKTAVDNAMLYKGKKKS